MPSASAALVNFFQHQAIDCLSSSYSISCQSISNVNDSDVNSSIAEAAVISSGQLGSLPNLSSALVSCGLDASMNVGNCLAQSGTSAIILSSSQVPTAG